MCSDRAVLEEVIAKRRNLKEWRITETANDKRKVCGDCGAKMDETKEGS
nr:MAG TPA: YhfH-like protein [Caudoviricetes sp.]